MMIDKKVAFYTLGCKLNFSETSTIARDFQNDGFERVEFEEAADIYVINTCSVTDNADKRFKSIVKSALKKQRCLSYCHWLLRSIKAGGTGQYRRSRHGIRSH